MTGAAGLSPRAWDGRLRHSRDQEDPLLLTPHTHHDDYLDDDHHYEGENEVVENDKLKSLRVGSVSIEKI